MKYIVCLILLFSCVTAQAHEEDTPIDSSSELREWCKSETEAYFIGKGITPYNWSASWWEDGTMLIVKGSWLVQNRTVVVECRIAKGAKRKYAVYEIMDQHRN